MHTSFTQYGERVIINGPEGDHIFRTIQHTDGFYEAEMLAVMAGLDPTATVVDVGANIGNHSIYLGLFTNADRVIAVEPYPLAADYLRRNISDNRLGTTIDQRNYALGATDGSVGLRPGPKRNIGHTKTIKGDQVQMRRLDRIVDDEVSMIKIDVEGNELEVLKGAVETLRRHSPYLFVEASNRLRRRRLDNFLAPFGYGRVGVFNGQPTYFYYPFTKRVAHKTTEAA